MKRILPIILCIALTYAGGACAAEKVITEISLCRAENTITVKAAAQKATDMTCMIAVSGETVTSANFSSAAIYINTAQVKNGGFEFIVERPQAVGQYDVICTADTGETQRATITIATPQEIDDIIDALSQADKNSVKTILQNNQDTLLLHFAPYEGISSKEVVYSALAQSSFNDYDEFLRLFQELCVNALIKESRSDLEALAIILKQLDMADKNGNGYKYFEDSGFKLLGVQEEAAKLLRASATLMGFDDELEKAVATALINVCESHLQVYDILFDFNNVFGINFSSYNALSDKSAVTKGLVAKNYTSPEQVKGEFNTLVAAAASRPVGGSAPSVNSVGSGALGSAQNVFTAENQAPSPTPKPFTDTAAVAWAEDAILELYTKNIISGRGNGIFDPNGNVTREEFVKMVVNAFDLSDSTEIHFDDVPEGAWYYSYVARGVRAGIIQGIGDSLFGTGRPLSRQDMAVIAFNLLKLNGGTKSFPQADFDDFNEIAQYARDGVCALADIGIINGVGGNRFAPYDNATRAAAAKIIYSLMLYVNNI